MLQHTFCHLPGISLQREKNFWHEGVTTWDDLELALRPQLTLFADRAAQSKVLQELESSRRAFEHGDAGYFASRLPKPEQYRIACSFPDSILFLDIETTGLSRYYDYITLIGVSRAATYKVFLRDTHPKELFDWLSESSAIVTFNGSLFDLPFLREQYGNLPIPKAHIDLRFLARRAGLSGGQKELEVRLKIKRPKNIEDLKGEAAPILWHRFRRGDSEALRRLIEYNHADIEGMKKIIETVVHRLVKKVHLPRDVIKDLSVRPTFSETNWSELNTLIANASLEVSGKQHIARLTIDDLVRTDQEPRLKVVGIDLTGSEARPTGWCLLDGKEVVTAQIRTDDELVSRTLAAKPEVVSIDSPLSLPKGRTSVDDDNHTAGIMRYCERLLKKRGVNVYPALIPSMKRLTARGISLANVFRRHGLAVIESYPGAAQDIMNIPRKRAGLEFLEMGLAEFGVVGSFLKEPVSHDELDAITSAIVGAFFWSGKFERLGEERYGEEALIIPDLKIDISEWSTRLIVGISGPLAAGKTTAAQYLEKMGFMYARYSQVIEVMLREKTLPITRENLQRIGEQVHQGFGQRWLGRELLTRLRTTRRVVIDGLRFPEDRAFWLENFGPGFVHIHIDAPLDVRKDRYARRGGSVEEFEKAEAHNIESQIGRLQALADIPIENNKDLDAYLQAVCFELEQRNPLRCQYQ